MAATIRRPKIDLTPGEIRTLKVEALGLDMGYSDYLLAVLRCRDAVAVAERIRRLQAKAEQPKQEQA
jgi:hypothetical protein